MKRLSNILLSINSNPFSIKVVITVMMFATLVGFVGMLEIRTHMNRILTNELKLKGQAIANYVASQSHNLSLQGGTPPLSNLTKDSSEYFKDVRYLLILDDKGHPTEHSFEKGIPVGLLELRQLSGDSQTAKAIPIDTAEGRIYDFAAPVNDGKAGWIRVGLSTQSMKYSIDELSRQILLTTLLLTVLGVFGALLVAHFVTRPIRELSIASKKIAEGDLSQRVRAWGKDELARLGKTFNLMASSIEKYTEEREALVKELQHNEQIRQELLKKVITAQEDERKRISRELHDETSQSLTSLIIGLKLLRNDSDMTEKQIQSISEIKDLASDTLREVHRLAVELRPTVLDDMGLIPAIERFLNGYSQNFNIDVDFHVQNKPQSRLPGEVETALYRIVQEALTNIAKYADAENASVLLDAKEEGVKLIVEDDGLGFDVEKLGQSDRHLGIAGMKERALLLNGKFTIESNAGQGTTIYVFIPLKRREINEIKD